MAFAAYLPSSQFVITLVSALVSASFIYTAYSVTAPKQSTATLESAEPVASNDWAQTLEEIQAESTFAALPEPLSPETVASFLDEAQTENLTETIGRTLLVNLSNAKSQGLGDDIPTQEQIIAYATGAFVSPSTKKTYTSQDILLTADSGITKKEYGNAVMDIVRKHPGASASETLSAMARATDNNDARELEALTYIQKEYETIVSELALVPVPQTLGPLHIQILNSLGKVASSFTEMRTVLTDPLRGLQGLQHYQLMLGETGRMFTTVAEQFNREAILFNEDEPGKAWQSLIAVE